MDFSFSSEVLAELKKIKQKQPQLIKKIQKQLKIFKENNRHPSLRTHKLKGNLADTWSISVEGNVRLIYTIKNNEAIFFKIGNHDEVYRNSRGENTGWISIDSLVGFAKNVHMPNISQFTECLNSHKFNQLVAQNDMFAKGIGLGSTPTFLILKDNSTKIAALEGAQPIKVFDDVIAQFLNNTL